MKKIFATLHLIGVAIFSTHWSRTSNKNQETNEVRSERVLELAKAEDGRLDLSILLASSRLPDERKQAFLNADEDKDGFLTQEVFKLSIPRSQNNLNSAVTEKNVGAFEKELQFGVSRETTSVNHELDEALRELEVWFYSENQGKAPTPRHKNERHSLHKSSRFQKKPEPRPQYHRV